MIGGMPSAPATAPKEALVSPGAVSLRGGRLRAALVPFLALLTSLVFCALLLLVAGYNPLTVYHALWSGAVTGQSAFANTLVSTTPYILLGLAVALGFKGGLFNIGAEGQYIVGAIGAVWAGHLFDGTPAILLATFALLVGTIAGALYATIAGVLKVLSGAHEVITTIMLNYVAAFLVSWLVDFGGIMHGTGQIQQSYYINPGAQLPIIWPGTPLHAGLIIALAIAVAIIGMGNPVGIVLAGLLLGALHNGATTMEASAGISGPFVNVIEASILFFVAAPIVICWIYFRWRRSRSA